MVGSEQIRIDLESSDSAQVRASIEGREYCFELQEVEPGIFWMSRDGRSVELQTSVVDGGYEVCIGERRLRVELLDQRAVLSLGRAVKPTRSEIRAPMPGRVVRILVEEGSEVGNGEGLLVVEAMKMQNEIRSVGPGKVMRIAVSEGQTVNAGDLLVVFGDGRG